MQETVTVMAPITVRTPQMRMIRLEEEEFGVVPYLDTPPALKKDPMINDCFFGSEKYSPSPIFKRNPSVETSNAGEDSLLNAVPPEAVTCNNNVYQWPQNDRSNNNNNQNYYLLNNNNNNRNVITSTTICSNGQWLTEIENNVDVRGEGWIEEWMDMNGIFDPAIEIKCSEFEDIPFCQSRDQVIPEVDNDSSSNDKTSITYSENQQNPIYQTKAGQINSYCSQGGWIPSDPQILNINNIDGNNKTKSKNETEKKNITRNYIFRPIPKNIGIEPLPMHIVGQPTRSVKIIKASSAVSTENVTKGRKSEDRKNRASPYISDKKREQNRSAAIRYRDKRREEAKRKKEELHDLELRNVALKTELSGLTTEIAYLKGLLQDVIG